MPRTTKAQLQSDLLHVAENLMVASIALEDDPDDTDLLGMDDDEADFLTDDIADVLDLESLNWMAIAQCMSGDGSRGSYDQIPKSVDFFSVCLRAPNHKFRHMFRSGNIPQITIWNTEYPQQAGYSIVQVTQMSDFKSAGQIWQKHKLEGNNSALSATCNGHHSDPEKLYSVLKTKIIPSLAQTHALNWVQTLKLMLLILQETAKAHLP
ncbi:hypothetical protein C8R43DRAFT_958468 [Mycena crocata]|nr:hypothetical protein C8R43DRAFT_958468 [Mycena crocata]